MTSNHLPEGTPLHSEMLKVIKAESKNSSDGLVDILIVLDALRQMYWEADDFELNRAFGYLFGNHFISLTLDRKLRVLNRD
jgi:hypothetical protein